MDESGFKPTPQLLLDDHEMVSEAKQIPKGVKIYDKVIDALREYKVTIRFVDKKKFDSLINNPNQKEMIKAIKPH